MRILIDRTRAIPFSNPRKFVYNKVNNRTSFDIFKILKKIFK